MPHMMRPENYQTFQILAPIQTHFRKGTCAEANCGYYTKGWTTRVPKGSPYEAQVRSSKRHWSSETLLPDGTIQFIFEPGQQCFMSPHQVRIEREEIFVVRGGDDRGNPRGTRLIHSSAANWTEDFMEHQDGLVQEAAKG